MKRYLRIAALVLSLMLIFLLCACEGGDKSSRTAACYNGNFVGSVEKETGVLSFKGIPYAKPPVDKLRWKAPEPVDASDETIEADEFGKSSIQYEWFTEPIETELSEDCLTLNVWAKDLETKDKAVMVFIHGGSNAWGGSSEKLYDGQYFVEQNEDVIIVTINYRLGMMGAIDFSSVPGGEEYGDSKELGLLDCVEALRWVKNNIAAFGGNPDNVTIFGESNGGTIVSCLLASDYAGELFQKAICESGNLKMTYTEDMFAAGGQTDVLMGLAEAETMDDLLALTEEELIDFNEAPIDEDEDTLNDLYNFPLRGGNVTKADCYAAITAAAEKGVDLLIGTNSDEANYWIMETAGDSLSEFSGDEIEEVMYYFENYLLIPRIAAEAGNANAAEAAKLDEYLSTRTEDEVFAESKLITETVFHQPAIRIAEAHSLAGSGKTYMYYFEKGIESVDFMGACHAAEVKYVFHNMMEGYFGSVDEKLADEICHAWAEFAKTGTPGPDWVEYDIADRNTMVIGDDGSFSIVKDPEKTARELLGWTVLNPFYAEGA